jgi:hypothetical protein
MKYDQDRQKVVARYYVKKENLKGVDPETVIDAMMRKKVYRKKIQNRVTDPTKRRLEGMHLSSRFQNLDEEKAQEKKAPGQAYKRTFLPERLGERRGTYRTFMNFLDHNDKGCYRDLLPTNEMCYPISEDTIDEVHNRMKKLFYIYANKNVLTELFAECGCFSLLIFSTAVEPLKYSQTRTISRRWNGAVTTASFKEPAEPFGFENGLNISISRNSIATNAGQDDAARLRLPCYSVEQEVDRVQPQLTLQHIPPRQSCAD